MEWVNSECVYLRLGDARLNKRAKQILKCFSDNPMNSIPNSCKGWSETKAAYRFFDNDTVTAKKIIKPHRISTLQRIQEHPIVLLVQDTTTLNYSGQKERTDLGPIQQDNVRGIFLHPTLAITPNRECLGVIDYEQWARKSLSDKNSRERRIERQAKGIKEKESYRWLKGYKKANKLAHLMPNTHFIYIADREADIYDIYHEASKMFNNHSADWLIRATFDRSIFSEHKLKKTVKATQSIGQIKFTVTPSGNRKKREVIQDVFVKKVKLHPPRDKGSKKNFKPIEVHAIITTELNPPAGQKPIEWVLLTSIPLDSLEIAMQIVQWYTCRWQIEIFFKILKSGCNIEKLQLNEKGRFDPCLAMYLIVAWRILFLTMLGRASPSLNSECVFEKIEWETAYVMIYKKPPPLKSPTLKDTIMMIARLGGFLGRKRDGEPGTIVMWRGLQNLYAYIRAREAFQSAFTGTYG